MPYKSSSELPESVRDHLPQHAQEIYREAFNSAWAAVKRAYQKDEKSGDWKPKKDNKD